MNNLELGLLIWALLATCSCLFIHGAKKDREAAERDEAYAKAKREPLAGLR